LKLSVEDRILIYGLQPEKGSYELLSSFRLLEPNIRFSEEETRKYDIKHVEHPNPEPGKAPQMMVAFNKEVAEGYLKEVKIPARMSSYLSEVLTKKEEDSELTAQYMSLYERFCLGKTPSTKEKVGKKDGNTDSN
jgi:hypothetical protein